MMASCGTSKQQSKVARTPTTDTDELLLKATEKLRKIVISAGQQQQQQQGRRNTKVVDSPGNAKKRKELETEERNIRKEEERLKLMKDKLQQREDELNLRRKDLENEEEKTADRCLRNKEMNRMDAETNVCVRKELEDKDARLRIEEMEFEEETRGFYFMEKEAEEEFQDEIDRLNDTKKDLVQRGYRCIEKMAKAREKERRLHLEENEVAEKTIELFAQKELFLKCKANWKSVMELAVLLESVGVEMESVLQHLKKAEKETAKLRGKRCKSVWLLLKDCASNVIKGTGPILTAEFINRLQIICEMAKTVKGRTVYARISRDNNDDTFTGETAYYRKGEFVLIAKGSVGATPVGALLKVTLDTIEKVISK